MTHSSILVANCLGEDVFPQFEHDGCGQCVFLGHGFSGGDRDIWYCATEQVLAVRNSGDPADCATMPLYLAVATAKDQGPGTMWSEAVSRYDDAVGNHNIIAAHHVCFEPNEQYVWDGDFKKVVGLYEDIQYRLVGKDYYIKDWHGNQLMIATYHEDGGCWQVREIPGELDRSHKIKVLESEKAIFLYAMLLREVLTVTGY